MKKRKSAYTVTDFGPGDGGKGGVVQKICIVKSAHAVLKFGGAQGSHGVFTSRGQSFNFSQFGCGTFEGIRTYVTDHMVIDPIGLMQEGKSLKYEHGVPDAFGLITVEAGALCATPYHGVASRLRELARKERQKGTVGVGIGETKLDSELHPELAIYALDLGRTGLRDRIEAIRQVKLAELAPIIDDLDSLWPQDRETAAREIAFITDPGTVDWIAGEFAEMAKTVPIVDRSYLEDEILSQDGTVVVESSHGILTDKYRGFHPYTSRLRTLPRATFDLLDACGYDGEVVRLGVTRGYQIRHGAGPLVTEDPVMADRMLPGSHKKNNRYQGNVRIGPLDLVSLRYSIGVCGGPAAVDGLAVTWFDQIMADGSWNVCDRYIGADDPAFFTDPSNIAIREGEDQAQLAHQAELAERLFSCKPAIEWHGIGAGSDSKERAIDLCSGVLREKLGVPVRMMSFGRTEDDKVCM